MMISWSSRGGRSYWVREIVRVRGGWWLLIFCSDDRRAGEGVFRESDLSPPWLLPPLSGPRTDLAPRLSLEGRLPQWPHSRPDCGHHVGEEILNIRNIIPPVKAHPPRHGLRHAGRRGARDWHLHCHLAGVGLRSAGQHASRQHGHICCGLHPRQPGGISLERAEHFVWWRHLSGSSECHNLHWAALVRPPQPPPTSPPPPPPAVLPAQSSYPPTVLAPPAWPLRADSWALLARDCHGHHLQCRPHTGSHRLTQGGQPHPRHQRRDHQQLHHGGLPARGHFPSQTRPGTGEVEWSLGPRQTCSDLPLSR